MKICITGGTGFIGSNLANALLKNGHDVTVLDNFATGNAGNVSNDAHIIKCDIRDADSMIKIINGFDAVYHLAAQTDVRVSIENPNIDYEVNFIGTKNVVEAAKRNNAKIIFTSSCAVYGNCNGHVVEDTQMKPLSQYAESKLQAESLIPKPGFVARLFNVYGPRGNSFVNKACDAVLNGSTVPIYGSGMQTRDYVHVNDVVAALMLALKLKGTYNIGTGKEATSLAVIHMIETTSGKKIKTKFMPAIEGEITRSVADAMKMKSEGWEAEITLAEGIRKLCGWIFQTN